MNLLEVIRVALLDLALHKFRSLLAALGIIFGVASVEGMISISEGAKRAAMEKFASLGVDNILIRSDKPLKLDSADGGKDGVRAVAEYGLLRKDFRHILSGFPNIAQTCALREMRLTMFSRSGKTLEGINVIATEPSYQHVTRSGVRRGRFLCDMDNATQRRVCVLGSDAARRLFSFRDPLGQPLHVGDGWYRVVGVLEHRSSMAPQGGEDVNSCIFIPLATAQARYGDVLQSTKSGSSETVRVQLDAIYLQLSDPDDILATADRLKSYLGKTHKIEDYKIVVPLAMMRQKEQEQRIWSIVMGAIAAISLVVGGIGIMNIMLANVSDRRKEIGTRRALGACRRDILGQFVLEAATLTSLGGLIGAALGYVLAQSITRYAGWPTEVTTYSVMLGVIVSMAVGVIFGLWPAWQAAKVNPIEALRSD